ncbi:MAG TPA: hypothetical protein VET23_06835, partial [Chitinophagaceae bacterium]|nr:hypothetical protein [Chitinophagaceae bacterium]
YWEGRLHIIFLSDLKENDLQNFCNSHQLNRKNFTLLNVQHELMPDYLSVADFAISPYKPTPSKKYCTPIKNGEYWAVGLPVIITKGISVDSDLIEENDIGYVLKSLTKEEYMNSIKKIDQLLNIDKETLRKKIRQVAIEKRSFSIAERIYRDIYS